VVPRNALKYQGEEEFRVPRLQTDRRIRAAENGEDLSRGLAGYVTTYQAVGIDPECHAAEFKRHKYILFLDEFHHVASGSVWHNDLTPLVNNAALVVLATGTLPRGDGQKTAFMLYSDGKPVREDYPFRGSVIFRYISYSRSEAVRDGAILPVEFRLTDGQSEWEEADGRRGASGLSGKESAKALFTALRTEFANTLLDESVRVWNKIKTDFQAARLLVVAPDIKTAKSYFDYLVRRGFRAAIATSEDTPLSRMNIEDYKRGRRDVLITVAMAYEGLDVPEISVICCLSHIRSAPWFEQCFARANRLAAGKTRAVVFAPADAAFKKAKEMIEREQSAPAAGQNGTGEAKGGPDAGEGDGHRRP